MDCKTANTQRKICPIIFGAASSVMCVSHQNRMNPVMIIFSNEKKGPGDLVGEESQGETGPYFWECRLCHALSSSSHGRGWVVTWEEVVQYGVPRKRETERPEFVISMSKMLLWVVQHEPVDLMFSLWDTELMRVWVLLRVFLVRSWALPRSLCCVGSVEMGLHHPLALGRTALFLCLLGKGDSGPSVLWSARSQHWQNFREPWITWEGADNRYAHCLTADTYLETYLGKLLSLIKEGFSSKLPYLIMSEI